MRMIAFSRSKNEILCMDLAFVNKLAKNKKGVKYLLFRQEVFDSTIDAKGKRTKEPKETVHAFSTMNTKNNQPTNFWVDKRMAFARKCEKFCKADGLKIYFTISETKAAFADCTIRPLEKKHYRYMENYAFKYIHKMFQFVTTLNSRKIAW